MKLKDMKTKILLSILVALPLVAGLTGCKSDDETTARPAKERLMVVGGNILVRVTATVRLLSSLIRTQKPTYHAMQQSLLPQMVDYVR